ncbi:drug/metabolite transporter (DMT)-like permease [Aquimarina sp. MAR_2010_214]|uniref:DMT family transporter n=1 Tax=Aquimarina sp. MAR_2010_214 TaxID=1250026 RepID=UPI000C700298|nr:EamA family transporter [Aquimarina sp. MAR_2010_214]PKV48435.1 drug/metabolite transporter (DMT)-like permease [Aquimarina sp. MAR_2010_214]
MQNTKLKWIYLAVLSLVWGSSFILIKKSLIGLTPLQLGALRTLFAATFLFLIGFRSMRKIAAPDWKWVIISAFAGTFIPAFLFAFAETEIDSGIASILNSTTPLVTLILGVLIFSIRFNKNQFFGVIVGLIGCVALILEGASVNPNQNYWYAVLVLCASVCYAINVNIIKRYMQHISPMAIANGNFIVLVIPALIVLYFSDFFKTEVVTSSKVHISLMYVSILAVVGTGIAKVLFNKLVQISTPVFATSVTYTIPIVAMLWGILDNEKFTFYQVLASGVIILGVYLANRNR